MTDVELVMEWLRHPGSKVFNGTLDEVRADLLARLLKCPAEHTGTIGKLQGEIAVIDMIRGADFQARLRTNAAQFLT